KAPWGSAHTPMGVGRAQAPSGAQEKSWGIIQRAGLSLFVAPGPCTTTGGPPSFRDRHARLGGPPRGPATPTRGAPSSAVHPDTTTPGRPPFRRQGATGHLTNRTSRPSRDRRWNAMEVSRPGRHPWRSTQPPGDGGNRTFLAGAGESWRVAVRCERQVAKIRARAGRETPGPAAVRPCPADRSIGRDRLQTAEVGASGAGRHRHLAEPESIKRMAPTGPTRGRQDAPAAATCHPCTHEHPTQFAEVAVSEPRGQRHLGELEGGQRRPWRARR
ncbi:hypothetical protein GA0070214_1021, partial [Micromonospora chaiyaphumensis]